jgi:hemoglobin
MIFELHPAGLNTIIPPGGKWMRVRYWHRVTEEEVYPTIGEDGFRRLVAAFYRQVPGDSILGPMYPADDLEGAEYRLRMFLIGRFGGPPTYIEERGHPRLRMRHLPFLINQVARDRWMALMAKALDEAQLPPEADAVLRHFFEGMSSFMMNS